MRRICEKFDLYWSENAYALVEKRWTNGSDGSRVRAYISKLNMIIYSDKTFDDTLDEEEIARLEKEKDDANLVTLTGVAQPEKAPEGPTEEMVRKWGPGCPNDMYAQLEARHGCWVSWPWSLPLASGRCCPTSLNTQRNEKSKEIPYGKPKSSSIGDI